MSQKVDAKIAFLANQISQDENPIAFSFKTLKSEGSLDIEGRAVERAMYGRTGYFATQRANLRAEFDALPKRSKSRRTIKLASLRLQSQSRDMRDLIDARMADGKALRAQKRASRSAADLAKIASRVHKNFDKILATDVEYADALVDQLAFAVAATKLENTEAVETVTD